MRRHPRAGSAAPRLLFPLVLTMLVLAGCGGGGTKEAPEASIPPGASQGASPSASPTANSSATASSTPAAALPAVTGRPGTKPTIARPQGAPPNQLVVKDLVRGKGAEVKPNATVTVHYVGMNWSNGKVFDSSWARGQPLTIALSSLIPGWQEGFAGMRVGGRRLLVVPPDKGYGESGQPPVIGPNETLVFVVDVLKAT